MLLALVCAAALAFGATTEHGYILWALALFLVGMPHGAYDLAALHRDAPSRRSLLRTSGVYTAIMLACVLALFVEPSATLLAFLLLAAHHFGVSDSVFTRGRKPASTSDHLAGVTHGLVVIATPFVLQPEQAWAPFDAIGSVGDRSWSPGPVVLAAAAGVLVGISVLHQARLLLTMRGRCTSRVIEQSATLTIALVLGLFTPPLFAIAVYFLCVHALGHCLRARSPGDQRERGSLLNVARVHLRSVPLLVPSVIIVLALALFFGSPPEPRAVALGFITFCAIATLPHHLLWLGVIGRHGRSVPR